MAVTEILLNVYEIDGQPQKTPAPQGFPVGSQVLSYWGNNPNLYGVVIGLTDNRHYAVVETPKVIVTLMNA